MPTSVLNEPPAISPPPQRPWRRRELVPVGLAFVICVATYVVFALSMGCELSGDNPRDAYYNGLVDGMLSGHTYLDKPMPAWIPTAQTLDLATARAANHGLPYSATSVHDLTFYRGRLYLYFSVVPALVLFLPWRVATGGYLSQQLATVIFSSGALAIVTALLVSGWRRFFPSVRPIILGCGVLAFGLVPLTPLLLQRSDVYEVPIGGAFFFTCAALACVACSAYGGRWTWPRAALLSTSVALAAGCRPSEIAVVALVLLPIYDAWVNSELRRWKLRLGVICAAVVPLAIVGVGMLAYNFARFGELLEFGQTYQLNGDPTTLAHFSTANVAYNAWHYFLYFPGWSAHFPFAGPWSSGWLTPPTIAGVEHPVGLLTAAPFMCLAMGAVWCFGAWPKPVRAVVVACVSIAAANAVVLCLFFGSTSRYEIAFAPYLALIAVIVLFSLEDAIAARSATAVILIRSAWAGALLFSIGYGVLFAVRTRGEAYFKIAKGRLIVDDLDAVVANCDRALRFDPDNLDVLRYKAFSEFKLNRDRAAAADLQTILDRDPSYATGWNLLGMLAMRDTDRADEAIAYFRRCVALVPRDPGAHYNLGLAYARAGILRRDDAIRELRYALRLQRDLATARRALEMLGEDPDS